MSFNEFLPFETSSQVFLFVVHRGFSCHLSASN
jgi:hypothetical protein